MGGWGKWGDGEKEGYPLNWIRKSLLSFVAIIYCITYVSANLNLKIVTLKVFIYSKTF